VNTKRHAAAILAIFNEAIANTTALYDYKTADDGDDDGVVRREVEGGSIRSLASRAIRGELMGFASYGTFPGAAPRTNIRWSIQCMWIRGFRRRGVGKRLVEEIIIAARGQNYHVLIGGH